MRIQVFSPTYPTWALVGGDFKASRLNCNTCNNLCVPPAPAQLRHRPWSSLDPEDYACKPVARHEDRGSVVEVNR